MAKNSAHRSQPASARKAKAAAPAAPAVAAALDLDAEFSRLFTEARSEHARLKKQITGHEPAHQAVLAFAREHEWKWAESLLEASRRERTGELQQTLQLLEEVDIAIPARHRGRSLHLHGNILLALGKNEEAVLSFREALSFPGLDAPGATWSNMGVALSGQGKHEEAITACREALATPGYDMPGFALNNLGTALSALGRDEEAIQAFNEALASPGYHTPGAALSNLGNVFSSQGKYDEAIKAYREALATPGFDVPGDALNNLGNVLAAQGKYDEAIEVYRATLATPGYDTHAITLNNLGTTLHAQDKHEEAVKAYREALNIPGYKTPGHALNNLGISLKALGRHEEAVQAYLQALATPGYDKAVVTWTNLAEAYAENDQPELAEAAFQKALALPDERGSDHARAKLGLQRFKAELDTAALSADDRALTGKAAPAVKSGEEALPAMGAVPALKVDDLDEDLVAAIREAGDTQYEKYIANKPDSKRDDTLSILRGWSSAVTLLEGSERRWRGGGYFLKWRGCGIVIDPGFDFLRNFHDAGYHGREIRAVLVSHNHPDHNDDLKSIDDLRYELYKRLAGTANPKGSDPYLLLWDLDSYSATKFSAEKPKHQIPPIEMPSGFPHPIDLSQHPAKLPLRVTPFKVNHGDDVPHAMGMVIELLNADGTTALKLGYTGDTGYFPDLHKHLMGCDALIAHISQPSIDELQDATKLKAVHLGYRGTALLLKECQPRLALIGEFWAGYTDLRIPLVKGLRRLSGLEHVLPTGLSMHLRLPSLEVECTECRTPVPFASVKTAPPTDRFGSLSYLCPRCFLG